MKEIKMKPTREQLIKLFKEEGYVEVITTQWHRKGLKK